MSERTFIKKRLENQCTKSLLKKFRVLLWSITHLWISILDWFQSVNIKFRDTESGRIKCTDMYENVT